MVNKNYDDKKILKDIFLGSLELADPAKRLEKMKLNSFRIFSKNCKISNSKVISESNVKIIYKFVILIFKITAKQLLK